MGHSINARYRVSVYPGVTPDQSLRCTCEKCKALDPGQLEQESRQRAPAVNLGGGLVQDSASEYRREAGNAVVTKGRVTRLRGTACGEGPSLGSCLCCKLQPRGLELFQALRSPQWGRSTYVTTSGIGEEEKLARGPSLTHLPLLVSPSPCLFLSPCLVCFISGAIKQVREERGIIQKGR